MKTKIENKTNQKLATERIVLALPRVCENLLPYIKEIRASWIGNKSHCDEKSTCRREDYIKKGIKFCPEWLEELGFIRYYIFHIDNGYIPKKTKLVRINGDKGFNPENCKIEVIPEKKKSNSIKKNNDVVIIDNANDNNSSPFNITNIVMFSDDLKLQFAMEVLKSIGINTASIDKKKGLIYLSTERTKKRAK